MTDDVAIKMTFEIVRAINNAGFTIFFGFVFHALISCISREMSK